MKPEILIELLILGAAGLGLGFLSNFPSTESGKTYDERQRMEQGKAGNLAMHTAVAYLVTAYAGVGFHLIPEEHLMIVMVFGLVLTLVVYRAYCIFRDSYLGHFSDPYASACVDLFFGIIWLVAGLNSWNRADSFTWLNLMLSFSYISEAVCVLSRAIYLHFRDRKEGEE